MMPVASCPTCRVDDSKMIFVENLHANAVHVSGIPMHLQLMKVQEEVGEVAAAWIGWVGNPRPEKRATRTDVVRELCDVALSALVALENLGEDSFGCLSTRAAVVRDRFEAT